MTGLSVLVLVCVAAVLLLTQTDTPSVYVAAGVATLIWAFGKRTLGLARMSIVTWGLLGVVATLVVALLIDRFVETVLVVIATHLFATPLFNVLLSRTGAGKPFHYTRPLSVENIVAKDKKRTRLRIERFVLDILGLHKGSSG